MPPGVGYPIASAAGQITPPQRGSGFSDIGQLGDLLLQRRDERADKKNAEARQNALMGLEQEKIGIQRAGLQAEQDRVQMALDEQGRLVRDREETLAGKPGLIDRVESLQGRLGEESDRATLDAMTPQQLTQLGESLRLQLAENLRIQMSANLERERIDSEVRLNLREQMTRLDIDIAAHQRARAEVQEELSGFNMQVRELAAEMGKQLKAQGLPEMTNTQLTNAAYDQVFEAKLRERGFDPSTLPVLTQQKQQLQNELRGLYNGTNRTTTTPEPTDPVSSTYDLATPQQQEELHQMVVTGIVNGTITPEQIDQLRIATKAPVGAWIVEANELKATQMDSARLGIQPPPDPRQMPIMGSEEFRSRLGMPAAGASAPQAPVTTPSAAVAPSPAIIAPQAGRSSPLLNLPGQRPDPVLQNFEANTRLRRHGDSVQPALRPPARLPFQ